MTKRLEDIKFSDSYSKKDLLEAIEWLQHNYKELKKTYDRAVYTNYKLSEILKFCNIKMDWDTVELLNEKEAEIQRLKEQLDREIKINRKMKSALEKYADPFNDMLPINELAQQFLKEIEEME